MDTKTLDELQGIAEKATPGKWKWYNGCSWWRLGLDGDQSKHDVILKPYVAEDKWPDISGKDCDRRFIAAFNPQTALTLIAEARKVQELEGQLKDADEMGEKSDRDYLALEADNKQLREALEKLVADKEANGYPLWFNRAVQKCAESRSFSGCDYEDLCNEHHDIAKGGFKDCEKYVQEFIAALSPKEQL